LIGEVIGKRMVETSLTGEEEELSESMERLALIELSVNEATLVGEIKIAEDKDRLDQTAIVLKCPVDRVMLGQSLKFANEE
jgi:hypothetical protein